MRLIPQYNNQESESRNNIKINTPNNHKSKSSSQPTTPTSKRNNEMNYDLSRPEMNKNRSTSAAVNNRPQSASSVLSYNSERSNSNLKSHRLFTAEDRPIFSNSNENSPSKPPLATSSSSPLKVPHPVPVQLSSSPPHTPHSKSANLFSPTTTTTFSMTNTQAFSKSTKFKTMSADAALKINETIVKNIENKNNMNRPKVNSNERSSSAPVVKRDNKIPTEQQQKKKKKTITTNKDDNNVNETKSAVSSVSTRTTVSIYSAKGDGNKKNAFDRLYTVKNMDTINELKKKYEDELMRPEKKLTRSKSANVRSRLYDIKPYKEPELSEEYTFKPKISESSKAYKLPQREFIKKISQSNKVSEEIIMKQKEKEAKKLSTSIKMSQRSVEMIKMRLFKEQLKEKLVKRILPYMLRRLRKHVNAVIKIQYYVRRYLNVIKPERIRRKKEEIRQKKLAEKEAEAREIYFNNLYATKIQQWYKKYIVIIREKKYNAMMKIKRLYCRYKLRKVLKIITNVIHLQKLIRSEILPRIHEKKEPRIRFVKDRLLDLVYGYRARKAFVRMLVLQRYYGRFIKKPYYKRFKKYVSQIDIIQADGERIKKKKEAVLKQENDKIKKAMIVRISSKSRSLSARSRKERGNMSTIDALYTSKQQRSASANKRVNMMNYEEIPTFKPKINNSSNNRSVSVTKKSFLQRLAEDQNNRKEKQRNLSIEMEKLRKSRETHKPEIIHDEKLLKKRSYSGFDGLYSFGQQYNKNRENAIAKKDHEEIEKCTFSPKIDKKSIEYANSDRGYKTAYERLYELQYQEPRVIAYDPNLKHLTFKPDLTLTKNENMDVEPKVYQPVYKLNVDFYTYGSKTLRRKPSGNSTVKRSKSTQPSKRKQSAKPVKRSVSQPKKMPSSSNRSNSNRKLSNNNNNRVSTRSVSRPKVRQDTRIRNKNSIDESAKREILEEVKEIPVEEEPQEEGEEEEEEEENQEEEEEVPQEEEEEGEEQPQEEDVPIEEEEMEQQQQQEGDEGDEEQPEEEEIPQEEDVPIEEEGLQQQQQQTQTQEDQQEDEQITVEEQPVVEEEQIPIEEPVEEEEQQQEQPVVEEEQPPPIQEQQQQVEQPQEVIQPVEIDIPKPKPRRMPKLKWSVRSDDSQSSPSSQSSSQQLQSPQPSPPTSQSDQPALPPPHTSTPRTNTSSTSSPSRRITIDTEQSNESFGDKTKQAIERITYDLSNHTSDSENNNNRKDSHSSMGRSASRSSRLDEILKKYRIDQGVHTPNSTKSSSEHFFQDNNNNNNNNNPPPPTNSSSSTTPTTTQNNTSTDDATAEVNTSLTQEVNEQSRVVSNSSLKPIISDVSDGENGVLVDDENN